MGSTRSSHPKLCSKKMNVTQPAAKNNLEMLHDELKRAKAAAHAAQQRQKAYADQHRSELEFEVGQLVLLSTLNLSLRNDGCRKLLPRWVGPMKITKRIGKVAYRLDLPDGWKIREDVSRRCNVWGGDVTFP